MGVPTGAAAQLMTVDESTYGTWVTPTKSYEMVSETMKNKIERIDSKGLRGGRRTQGKWYPGKRSSSGDVQLEVNGAGFGWWFKHALGANVVTGAGPAYTHTCTIADLPVGFSMQMGKPSVDGTVQPFSYSGCRIASWELSLKAGELLMFKPSIAAQDELTATALATFTDPAINLMTYAGGTVTLGGTQVDLLDFTFKGDNKLDTGRFRVRGAATPKQQLENALRQYTGSLTADFESLTQYNHYTAGDELSIVATFQGIAIPGGSGAKYQVVITANVRYNPDVTPVVSGPSLLQQPIPFEIIGSGANDTAALSVVYTTTDAAP